jgi:hypothetical protein
MREAKTTRGVGDPARSWELRVDGSADATAALIRYKRSIDALIVALCSSAVKGSNDLDHDERRG